MSTAFLQLTAVEIARLVAEGRTSAEEVTRAHLDHIAKVDAGVGAWAFLDPDHAIAQARGADAYRRSGRAIGQLHGVPVGVKDIFDTRDMPTENGTPLDAGRRPSADAIAVARLRQAGAIVLGKTVTTELAVYTPGKTRNPHDPTRTPGGSSSGSAAAVAAGMAPLALGSQTNGSVIRPASYCGIVGFKPSRGLISRRGALTQSPTLDTVGTLSRSVDDAALMADVLVGYDEGDPASRPTARPDLFATATSRPALTPSLALIRTTAWEKADNDVHAGFAELHEVLGAIVTEVELPEAFAHAQQWHRMIMLSEIARSFSRYTDRDPNGLSAALRGMIDEGLTIRAVDYCRARDNVAVLNAGLEAVFDRFDAILTPAATGQAPGLESTGDPVFCTLWTYCGLPALCLPLLSGSDGLPIGTQLIGRYLHDGRLLRTARWLQAYLLDRGRAEGGAGAAYPQ